MGGYWSVQDKPGNRRRPKFMWFRKRDEFHFLHAHLNFMEARLMAAIDDLKAEVATVAADVLAAIDKFTNSLPPSQDPAIAAR